MLDYCSFLSENQSGIGPEMVKEQGKLIMKVPFLIPYNNISEFDISREDIVVFEGEFYRADSKVVKKDTLITTYHAEALTRQSMFELMGAVAGHVEKQTQGNPLKSLNKLIKGFSKNFYSPEYS